MRISDWSSDVCSSDLHAGNGILAVTQLIERPAGLDQQAVDPDVAGFGFVVVVGVFDLGILGLDRLDLCLKTLDLLIERGAVFQIGRASCRERVCQYV